MSNNLTESNEIMNSSMNFLNIVLNSESAPKQHEHDPITTDIIEDKAIFPDFKSGLLSDYRTKSTFCYKRMNVLLEGEEHIRFKHRVWRFMEKHPDFQHELETPSLDRMRHLATRRSNLLRDEQFFTISDYITRPQLTMALNQAMFSYEFSYAIKYTLSNVMFLNVLYSLGSERVAKYAAQVVKGEIVGAFALTEISHGTNAMGMRTRATYDKKTEEFVIHTPDFESAKCWVGNLGKTCTHAIVYAQLYVPDDVCHGLNAFLVPIRDQRTLLPFPGVTVGDLGEKVALNGVDNGFAIFNNYRIPKENLLSKAVDIDEHGNYVTLIKDKRKRMGTSLSALSSGRVAICTFAYVAFSKAIVIATRYSACRKQFGPEGASEEWPVLEYQSQQYRLLPHLAGAYALRIFSMWISGSFVDMFHRSMMGEDVAAIGMEIHVISSATKPVCTWATRDAIQECREACGGHGYLKVATLGDLRNENDANCTYEGENNTLIQQASNWLISMRRKRADFAESSPMGSVEFLKDMDDILQMKATENTVKDVLDTNNLLKALNWLVVWQLDMTVKRFEDLKKQGMNLFETRNNVQVFNAQQLSIIYGHRTVYYGFHKFVHSAPASAERAVLMQLLSLYGAHLVTKYAALFYQGGYFTRPNHIELYQRGILELLPNLKNEAISLADAIAPTDFILNSPLGMSDGNIYHHLQRAITTAPGVFERPSWWLDVTAKNFTQKSKF